MVDDLEGASMPDGIDVDEAAAYFGVFESSDVLHQMMEMPREAAFERFFALLSDLVLKPGEFDFKEASERLSCEGGEIYFLVAGHLGVMSLPEQLTLAIEEGQFSEDDAVVLNELTDPMRLLKLFAIAYQTGGEGESTKYLKSIETMMMKPAANKDLLLTLASEMKGAFDVSGHVTPIPSLASESANASAVEAADVAPLPPREVEEKKPVAKPPTKPEPKTEKLVEEKVEQVVPLPKVEKEEKIPLPKVEKVVEVDNRKETEKTEDAFSGAFGLIEEEPEPEVKPEITEELEAAVSVEEKEDVAEESEDSETDASLEDAFAAADVDGSGGLSIEEVAEATGLDIEDAAKLHAEADVDGDGQVTLEELKSKPEVVEKMALPKPVKPVRAGVANPQQQQPVQQQAWQQQQQEAQQQAWQQQQLQQQQAVQQQAWQQQQQAQQQGWNQPAQPIQPTIQSGLTCRGCRIGVDVNWRFCPVCGTQNR